MKKMKLRSYVVPTLSLILLLGIFSATFFMQTSGELSTYPQTYVTDIILGNKLPVINEIEKIINPYSYEKVTVGKTFYDYKGTEEEQTKSIVRYDDTYMQNSGIDFVCNDTFDIQAILNGEVISVDKDETLGNVIKIEHSNGYVSVYQSLSEVSVKKGDKVNQGQVIGKSGENKIDEELGNHLHFELYINNQMVDPADYLDKELNIQAKEE